MRDRPVIFAGLVAFLAVAAFPFWYNALAGRTAAPPVLKLPPPGTKCVAPAAYMKASHMWLLDRWRDQVVRTGVRQFKSTDGRTFDMSLLRTCLAQCHQDRAEYCDRCHAYAGLSAVSCWSCH